MSEINRQSTIDNPQSAIRNPRPPAAAESARTGRLTPEPMDPQLKCVQPGGGFIIRLELLWGRWRRWWLKTFRKAYVDRMALLREGEGNPCPHDVLDPRDLKFYRNQQGWHWNPQDDPFAWRDRIPFARWGLAELLVFSALFFGLAKVLILLRIGLGLQRPLSTVCSIAAGASIVIGLLVVWFFRDPNRTIPQGANLVLSPADGKVVEITELERDEFLGGPAVRIGIFLSIFNVHINRMPIAGRVVGLTYKPGKCLNAMRPESARENEQLAIRIEGSSPPHRRMVVRQITGAIARRIVCDLKPGDELEAGDKFGMIKLGSRTEIVIPREEGLQLRVAVGDRVQAGSSVFAEYAAG